MSSPVAIDRPRVATPQGDSGVLGRTDEGYLFRYQAEASRAAEISLLMPHRLEPYVGRELLPIFQMNLPEGYLLERLRQRLAKATPTDPMLLLALTGRETAIGRVRVEPWQVTGGDGNVTPPAGESLAQILAWDGAESLFDELAQRYLLRSGISGVQPKLLVPEASPEGKLSLATSELIVKSGGAGYPGVAVNEFVCMSIARAAGIPVPEFFLSDNRQLLVMRRFDRTADGKALGFEEMVVLMGKGSQQKYEGSYEQVARFVSLFCAPDRRAAALTQLFDQVALSCILGNGDAHLKNFGVLYENPTSDDVWLAPAYDLVNTTAYLPSDALALTLGGSRRLPATRKRLHEFAQRCGITKPESRLEALLDTAVQGLEEHRALLETEPVVRAGLQRSVGRSTESS